MASIVQYNHAKMPLHSKKGNKCMYSIEKDRFVRTSVL